MRVALVLGASYLLGSIPFSFLVARLFGVRDVRQEGSGNVGATNVMRTAGKLPGLLAFLLDASKGAMAPLLARWAGSDDLVQPAAATLAVLGHVFPVWLRFRGGKGVATGVGAFFPLAPIPSGLAIVVFVLTLLLTRFVSLASLSGTLALVVAAFFRAPLPVSVSALLSASLIFYRHRGNLERLARGTEPQAGRTGR